MTENEAVLCRKGILDKIVDAESAAFVQDLYIRLQSAAGTMESALQECVSIYDELEQATNVDVIEPVSIRLSDEVVAAKDEMALMAEILHDALLEGAKALQKQGIVWYAEGERLEMNAGDGVWIPCWHVETDEEVSTVCLGYYGGPRTQVQTSSLRRPEEQE